MLVEDNGAIDELLLAQPRNLACGDLPSTLQGTSAREGPVRAATSLVLHRCDSTRCSPIHRVLQSEVEALVRAQVFQAHPQLIGGFWLRHTEVCPGELVPRLVCELVQAQFVESLLRVVCEDGLEILLEGFEAYLLLRLASVGFPELLLEFAELNGKVRENLRRCDSQDRRHDELGETDHGRASKNNTGTG